ncbi:hypothetical protein BC829DRAFT_477334 [Chytridium lagenaria]|nr:hypothetical protein BC829DRAFT_477334 [Chytridium lagenaria]
MTTGPTCVPSTPNTTPFQPATINLTTRRNSLPTLPPPTPQYPFTPTVPSSQHTIPLKPKADTTASPEKKKPRKRRCLELSSGNARTRVKPVGRRLREKHDLTRHMRTLHNKNVLMLARRVIRGASVANAVSWPSMGLKEENVEVGNASEEYEDDEEFDDDEGMEDENQVATVQF